MELKEGNLCFICDEFMDKYGIKYSIMENKGIGNREASASASSSLFYCSGKYAA